MLRKWEPIYNHYDGPRNTSPKRRKNTKHTITSQIHTFVFVLYWTNSTCFNHVLCRYSLIWHDRIAYECVTGLTDSDSVSTIYCLYKALLSKYVCRLISSFFTCNRIRALFLLDSFFQIFLFSFLLSND